MPIDDFRLLCLSYRPIDPAPRRRAILTFDRPNLDLLNSGRVVFRHERAYDATSARALIHPRPDFTAIRAAVVLDHAAADARPDHLATRLRWPRFFCAFQPESSPRFDGRGTNAPRPSPRRGGRRSRPRPRS